MHNPSASVLIVDDDPGIADSLSLLFEDEGYHVAVAANGRGALEYLELNAAPRVILLDLMMPVMDGFRFRSSQLENPKLASIPVIVMTAGALDSRAQQLGALAYLRKPLDVDQLLEAVSRSSAGGAAAPSP